MAIFTYPKNPDPSLEYDLRVPIPSEKNRNVGVPSLAYDIPGFLGLHLL